MNMSESAPDQQSRALPPAASRLGRRIFGTGFFLVLGIGLCWVLGAWLAREPEPEADLSVATAFEGLHSSNATERATALRQVVQLGMSDTGRSIPVVIEALKDSDAGVRARAAESLSMLGSYAVLDGPGGAAAQSTDGGLVTAVTSALVGSLADDDQSDVRAAAADALRNISITSPRAVESPRGKRKKAGATPEPAAAAVSVVDHKAVVAALSAALLDRDEKVRSAAAKALGGAAPRVSPAPPQGLVTALSDSSSMARAAAARALPSFDSGLDPIIPKLIQMSAKDGPAVHRACAEALGQIKQSAYSAAAVPALIEGLKDRDREVRIQVVSLLRALESKATEAIPALVGTLNEPLDSDQTKGSGGPANISIVVTGPAHEAAKAIGEIAPKTKSAGDAIEALAKVVRSGPAQRRSSAAEALGKFGPEAAAAVPDLLKLLKQAESIKASSSNHDAEAAATALSRIAAGSPSVEPIVSGLRDSLKSRNTPSKAAVIRALERFGPKATTAIPDIQALQQDGDRSVRDAASKALKAIDRH